MQDPTNYYSEDQDPYLDRANGVLFNIPNLKSASELESYEEIIFQASFTDASNYVASQDVLNLDVWKETHNICFKDVYEWAGKVRSIRMAKGNSVFAYPENITSESGIIFSQINELLLSNSLTHERLSQFFAEVNVLHPFRDGNGRTQRIIFSEIYKRIGCVVDYGLTNQSEMIGAMIDGYRGKYDTIHKLMRKISTKK